MSKRFASFEELGRFLNSGSDPQLQARTHTRTLYKISTKKVQEKIYQIRKAVWLGKDILSLFKQYYDLTGDMTHTHLIPYTREEAAQSVAKARENARVMCIVGKARIALITGLVCPDKRIIKTNYHPDALMTADYSGGALQGKYMGPKAQKSYNPVLPGKRVSV